MIDFYRKSAITYFPAEKNLRILDIGCGMGFLLLALKEAGYTDIKGIDADESQVKACNENGLNVIHAGDSFEFLRQQKGQFDVISAFDLIEHIPVNLQIEFVNLVFEALTEEGKFILTTPNANSFLASRNRYLDFTHHCLFTEVSLDFVLYNGGFNNIKICPFEYVQHTNTVKSIVHKVLLKTFRFFRRLELISEIGTKVGKKVPLSFNLIGIATKK